METPPAEEPAADQAVTTTSSGRRSTGRRACVECRRRKIKCDRQYPCLACVTSGHECLQPPPGPPRRPRRRNHHELHDKIAQIESLLRQYVGGPNSTQRHELGFGPESQATSADELGSFQQSDASKQSQPQRSKGQLVHKLDGTLEFRDSKAMTVVFEDLQTIRALIEVELDQATWLPESETPGEAQQSCSLNMSFTSQLFTCIPSENAIKVLWSVFLERVDPLTKIIHVPTFRTRVIDSMNSFTSIPLATQALMFSIFLTASGSLTRQEHWDNLGQSKTDAIANFDRGLRLTLTKLNYLRNHNLEVLRSLVLYSLFQQTRYGSYDPWILNGVVINIACRLGLHLDGTHTSLSPFECEMRRRLWWQIVILETRSGGTVGTGSHLLPSHRNTRIPLNVDDEDLNPTMVTEPQPNVGPTEMSFCIVTYKAKHKVLAQPHLSSIDDVLFGPVPSTSPQHSSASTERSETVHTLQQFSKEFNIYLSPLETQLCPDPSTNPLHGMARCGRQALIRIVEILVTPMEDTPEWGIELHNSDDNFFRVSLAVIEEVLKARKAASHRFAWHADIDFKVEIFYYLGAQLQSRISGTMADRAWTVIEETYGLHEELWELGDKENMTLANILLVAWGRRIAHFAESQIVLPEPPFLCRLRDEVMTIKAQALGLF
ncbi:fungal specific transcription factor domain-containing protein [Colletotrichum truncatum]|uniref:Fungal specific transcription factor domain-containing protein n=1 Tax=Colletotrichum truncatum TaxID=5467 RepID=A0ACC3Z2B0_COLTU|nr:fungal specific transcription factor domain-containing protein [Colletotrichum truncatum]KAF6786522.1 fungal specific transcription factor domain-containing protein [Colletotrichum truncatum]